MAVSQNRDSAELAKHFYQTWRVATNVFAGDQMLPHLLHSLNQEHPTNQQLMIAMMLNLLNGIKTEWADTRNLASNKLVESFKEWLELERKSGKLYFDRDGYLEFPFI